MSCIIIPTVFLCSGSAMYLMMLEIEAFMQKYVFCRILDCHKSPGELELAMASWESVLSGVAHVELAVASRQLAVASLTAQHGLSTRLVANKGYPRLVLAVFY